jgi:Domain of unknown function (DUF1835).
MLNICYGKSAKHLLKSAFTDINDTNIIDMELLLSFGDINSLDKLEVRSTLIYDNIPIDKQRIKLNHFLNKFKEIRIWTSTGDANDYCNFLYTLELINGNDNDIYIIDSYEELIDKK